MVKSRTGILSLAIQRQSSEQNRHVERLHEELRRSNKSHSTSARSANARFEVLLVLTRRLQGRLASGLQTLASHNAVSGTPNSAGQQMPISRPCVRRTEKRIGTDPPPTERLPAWKAALGQVSLSAPRPPTGWCARKRSPLSNPESAVPTQCSARCSASPRHAVRSESSQPREGP